jgi:hypothetical protein
MASRGIGWMMNRQKYSATERFKPNTSIASATYCNWIVVHGTCVIYKCIGAPKDRAIKSVHFNASKVGLLIHWFLLVILQLR